MSIGSVVDTRLWSPTELAEYLGVPVSTVYRWNHMGSGPRVLKVGRHARYRFSDVNLWLEEQSGRLALQGVEAHRRSAK